MTQRKKPSSGKEAEKRALTRRAVLAGLGIGAALPVMNGLGQAPPGGSEAYEAAKKRFNDEYWPAVEPILKKREKAKGRDLEELDLQIHAMRTEFAMSANKSGFPLRCAFGSPTPLPVR